MIDMMAPDLTQLLSLLSSSFPLSVGQTGLGLNSSSAQPVQQIHLLHTPSGSGQCLLVSQLLYSILLFWTEIMFSQ